MAEKFVILRVKEPRLMPLLSLLIEKGYSEFSVVADLASTILKQETPATPSKEEPSSSSAAGPTAAAAGAGSSSTPHEQHSQLQQLLLQQSTTPVKAQHSQHQQSSHQLKRDEESSADPTDILQALLHQQGGAANDSFDDDVAAAGNIVPQQLQQQHPHPHPHQMFHVGPPLQHAWVLPNGEIMPSHDAAAAAAAMAAGQPMVRYIPGFVATGGDYGAGPSSQSTRSLQYNGVDGTGRKMQYAERMKGWQRRMITEAIATRGVPVGAELAELCKRAQVSEIQAVRFFRKRRLDAHGGAAGSGDYHMDEDADAGRMLESPDAPPEPTNGAFHPKIEESVE